MSNIESYKKRFYSLMESQMGDVKPLINEQVDTSCLTDENKRKFPDVTFNTETGMAKSKLENDLYKFECGEDGQIIINERKLPDNPYWDKLLRYYNNNPNSEWKITDDGVDTTIGGRQNYLLQSISLTSTNDKFCSIWVYNDGRCGMGPCGGDKSKKGTWSMSGDEPVFNFNLSITKVSSGLVSDKDTNIRSAIYDDKKIMNIGSKGPLVKKLQHWLLNNALYRNYNITNDIEGCKSDETKCDGIYGKQTKEAVKKLQDYYHIQVDGIVGAQTIDHMGPWTFK